ncbi:acyltransferase family protein [Flavobacterium aquicola]|uniref:Peptidoglycan/LPS O-acetylase OafA/YrhL n=1 Tax=Flavobacterium aquicola TaxID=1682742 RepID=A0A3E0EXK3_9FLAO|nr:acyltransferase [Flavobacterium aquicola]REH01887.1 peptidoglycan/LPS O-acetylase OafA/YrhL [Flavobacterium aquicola]
MIKPGLVRFALASLVVLFHITKFVFIGHLAVYCFFILSGYWVSLMYETKYSKTKQPLLVYYCSRIFRLLPVYYLISVLTFIMLFIFDIQSIERIDFTSFSGIGFALINIFMLGYNQLNFAPLVPAWSLDIELQFYLLLPIFLLFLQQRKKRILFISISFILTLVLSFLFTELFICKTILKYLVFFLIGIEIYKSKIEFKPKTETVFNALFIGILILHYIIPDLFAMVKSNISYNELFNILISLFLIPLLANSVVRKSDSKDVLLGGMSYVLYLSHWMFIIPYNYYIKDLTKIDRIPYTLGYLLATYLFSILVYQYYDMPLDKLRKKWVSKRM